MGRDHMNEFYINLIISKGLDLKLLTISHVSELFFCYFRLANIFTVFSCLINNGLPLSNELLLHSIRQKNNNIINLLLENGLSINKNVTKTIFEYPNFPIILNMLKYPCDLSWIETDEH